MKESKLLRDLLGQTIIKFILGILLVAVLLFLPAGTLDYLNGWLLMAVLFLPMLPVGILSKHE